MHSQFKNKINSRRNKQKQIDIVVVTWLNCAWSSQYHCVASMEQKVEPALLSGVY